MEDIFSQFGDIFGSAFGGFGGFGGSGRSRTSKGTNLRIKVSLTIDEIANGSNKKIKVKEKFKPLDLSILHVMFAMVPVRLLK